MRHISLTWSRETILVKHGSKIARRSGGKRITARELGNLGRTFQYPPHQVQNPWIALIGTERSEPHLPIQPRLVGCDPGRTPSWVSWLVLEFVWKPGSPIIGAFQNDFCSGGCHHCE